MQYILFIDFFAKITSKLKQFIPTPDCDDWYTEVRKRLPIELKHMTSPPAEDFNFSLRFSLTKSYYEQQEVETICPDLYAQFRCTKENPVG